MAEVQNNIVSKEVKGIRRSVHIEKENQDNLYKIRGAFLEAGLDVNKTTMLNMMLELGLEGFDRDSPSFIECYRQIKEKN